MKNTLLLLFAFAVVVVAGCSDTPNSVAPITTDAQHLMMQTLNKGEVVGVVPNSYIVLFSSKLPDVNRTIISDRSADLDNKIKELNSRFTFEVTQKYESCFTGFAATMDAITADALSRDPRIEIIEPDRYIYAFAQTLPTGINRVDADVSSTIAGDGSGTVTGVDIYIIDTGIQTNHPDLNVKGGINYTGGSSSNFNDGNGHGTHVAGTAAAKDNTSYVVGVAPGADLYAVRVLNSQGSGQFSWVLSGVNWVTARKTANPNRPMVANMSLGAYVGTTSYNSLDLGIKNSISKGVTYAIAAGNSNDDAKWYSPAHVIEAITVGAYDPTNNTWAYFSNKGSYIDILAPGVNILSTYKNSSTATMSGTSMATPHVTGTAALYLSAHSGDTPAQVLSALLYAASHPAHVNPGNWNSNPIVSGVPTGTYNLSDYAGNF